MNTKKLFILAVIAFLMVLWAFYESGLDERGNEGATVEHALIQGLDFEGVSKIVVKGGDDTVTLKRRSNGGFSVLEKDGYPATLRAVNRLTAGCLDIEVKDVYTSTVENFDELGVSEDEAENVVKFYREGDELLTGVFVGSFKEGGEGTFVRRVDSNDVYVTYDRPYLTTSVDGYVNQRIV